MIWSKRVDKFSIWFCLFDDSVRIVLTACFFFRQNWRCYSNGSKESKSTHNCWSRTNAQTAIFLSILVIQKEIIATFKNSRNIYWLCVCLVFFFKAETSIIINQTSINMSKSDTQLLFIQAGLIESESTETKIQTILTIVLFFLIRLVILGNKKRKHFNIVNKNWEEEKKLKSFQHFC